MRLECILRQAIQNICGEAKRKYYMCSHPFHLLCLLFKIYNLNFYLFVYENQISEHSKDSGFGYRSHFKFVLTHLLHLIKLLYGFGVDSFLFCKSIKFERKWKNKCLINLSLLLANILFD